MSSDHDLRLHALRLRQAAEDFQRLAARPGASAAAAATLESLDAALRAIGAGWYELADDAAPGVARRPSSGTVDSSLAATLHELAATIARCARECREARSVAEPLIGAQLSRERAVRNATRPVWPGRRRIGPPSPRGDWR